MSHDDQPTRVNIIIKRVKVKKERHPQNQIKSFILFIESAREYLGTKVSLTNQVDIISIFQCFLMDQFGLY